MSTKSTGKDNDVFTFRANPTCKHLQQDIANVHNIIRNTKNDITTSIDGIKESMDTGFDDLTKLLTNDITGVIPHLQNLETETRAYEDRLAAVEEKLALVEASESVVLQSSLAHEAAIKAMQQRVNMAAVILQQFEKKFESTHSRILHNTQLINENKYKISGIPLVEGESPFTVAKNFFVQIMNIAVNDGDIIVVSRLPGTLTVRIDGNRVQLPPQMFVKVTSHLQRRIASNLAVLEGKLTVRMDITIA